MKNDGLSIPFVKPVRVRNYKLWRGKYVVGRGEEKISVDCVYVSNLDGSWQVRIPSTSMMYATVCNGYATTDSQMRDDFLGMVLTNIYNISTSASVALHDGLFFLTEMMTFPYLLLSEKEMSVRMEKGMKAAGIEKKRRREHVKEMCGYRRKLYELLEQKKGDLIETYERQQAMRREYERVAEEEELKQDDIADAAMEILSNEEEKAG